MSRIGLKPIPVPSGVTVTVADRHVTVKGPKAELSHAFPVGVGFSVENNIVTVSRHSEQKRVRAMHGTARALVANMIHGVKTPFVKTLEIYGTGFSAIVSGQSLTLDIGFSNKIVVSIPQGLDVKAVKGRPVLLHITGADKGAVGQLGAVIRAKRPPTPYGDNKGIRYRGETIRKKAGKAFGEKK